MTSDPGGSAGGSSRTIAWRFTASGWGDRAFVERISSVQKQVVDPRNVFLTEAGKSRAYDFAKEPFSVRVKDFTPLAGTEGFIRSFIPKLCHECDGAFLVIYFVWAI
jgi:hypothetical protein